MDSRYSCYHWTEVNCVADAVQHQASSNNENTSNATQSLKYVNSMEQSP